MYITVVVSWNTISTPILSHVYPVISFPIIIHIPHMPTGKVWIYDRLLFVS